uniref:Uncharacterized protein TCIL3000_11_840 n=1 Tax=Trypanosoma congolense (strain IL3000) TaxID=1068625 RepID=G0UZ83_TRYCI|nr:unnamed protein product [Trypanosoma congolense IL3000]
MRMGLHLRCLRKELSTTAFTTTEVLRKVFCPTTHPSELASLAEAATDVVPQLGLPQTVAVVKLFSQHGVRHEPLMIGCFWKIFKSALPIESYEGDGGLMQSFAACTAAAFHTMCSQGFVHDPQLLAVGLGRCTECAAHMTFPSVVDVYQAMKDYDRKFFSLAEVGLHSESVNEQRRPEERDDDSPTLFSSQPNLVDVLCGELESRLVAIGREAHAQSAHDLERLLKSLAVVGVSSGSAMVALCELVKPMAICAELLLSMLTSVHTIHARVVDVLDHAGDELDIEAERTELVKLLTDKLLHEGGTSLFRNCNWKLVLDYRKLFEKHPALSEDAPELWDAVRTVRVSHKYAVGSNGERHRLGGELFKNRYAVKVKPITTSAAEVERFVPPQFKTWRGPAVHNNRHKTPKTPRRVAFGVQKISRDYLKKKRRKFTPSVW